MVIGFFFIKSFIIIISTGPLAIFPFGYLLNRAINEPMEFELDLARRFGRIYGIYSGLLPTLTVNDAKYIKAILIKDFPQFMNRRELNSYHDLWNGMEIFRL